MSRALTNLPDSQTELVESAGRDAVGDGEARSRMQKVLRNQPAHARYVDPNKNSFFTRFFLKKRVAFRTTEGTPLILLKMTGREGARRVAFE